MLFLKTIIAIINFVPVARRNFNIGDKSLCGLLIPHHHHKQLSKAHVFGRTYCKHTGHFDVCALASVSTSNFLNPIFMMTCCWWATHGALFSYAPTRCSVTELNMLKARLIANINKRNNHVTRYIVYNKKRNPKKLIMSFQGMFIPIYVLLK